MLTVSGLGMQFGKRVLFDEVNLKFSGSSCYGVIGANGAGKSTFLKILAGDLEPTHGEVTLEPGKRMAVLRQNHFEYEECEVMDTVLRGHEKMYAMAKEKDAIYMDPDATEADGMRAAELENAYGEMGGWMAETDAAELLSNLGVKEDIHYSLMKDIEGGDKVKVLLAQALFGNPDILLLDEPTNDIDAETVVWLSDFLAGYKNTVIVVSHDRHFLDMVCTNIVDVDYGKIKIFSGNYSFWYHSSQLILKQRADKNKKDDAKRKELQEFIARFSANASKAKQATSRKKALEKINVEDIEPSSRKYPYINFTPERLPGNEILEVNNLKATNSSGEVLFDKVTFRLNKGDKVAILSRDAQAVTEFFNIIAGEKKAESGDFLFGQTIKVEYMPNEHESFFIDANDDSLVDWLRFYSKEKDDQFVRGFLGRMLFSGEEVFKKVSVLSGGEKVRCMFSKSMVKNPNFLIFDEPTNHLDLESITALNNALVDFKGSFLLNTHDREILNTSCNRIIEITPNGIIDQLMSFDEYVVSKKIKGQKETLYA